MVHLIAIDFETTGFSASGGDAIVELGAVKFTLDTGCIDEFSQLVNPHRPIPRYATDVHGISNSDTANAKDINSIWREFTNWAGNFHALVAHNAAFEQRFIEAFNPSIAKSLVFIDTLKLSRLVYDELNSHKLALVCEHVGYCLENAHRALPDARATAHILIDIARKNPSLLSDLIANPC